MPGYLRYGYFDLGLVQSAVSGDFESALVAKLNAISALAPIVGSRIFPAAVPESQVTPAVSYVVEKSDREFTLKASDGVVYAHVNLGLRSFTKADTNGGREAIRNSLNGFSGNLASSVRVDFAKLIDEDDGYEQPDASNDKGTFWMVLTFQFKYREPLPTLN